ncbi:fibroblast growth factor binding protein 2a [Colossoma macropomum]|uniref:fibroblast growth factor binding protein 2a n=1 Tax=Colossoma macropomum TaxID=42526 RepID=UPI0018651246|nr:fibroblast growth factor binding protein 2a [Colossoma macropomum]
MHSLASALLLSCCFWSSLAQSHDGEEQRRSVWDDPIQFSTKAKDQCSMMVTGQGELTKLRISCQSQDRSYWCEYQGRPHVCRPYNNNPRHFFTQIMWDLRKLRNACQGKSAFKPFMCKRASDEAQMVFATSSSSYDAPVQPGWTRPDTTESPTTREEIKPRQARPDYPKSDQVRPEQVRPNGAKQRMKSSKSPSRSQAVKTDQARAEQGRGASGTKSARPMTVLKPKMTTPATTAPPPTTPVPLSTAKRLAKQRCWPSLQGVCAFVIGWFTY